MSVIKSMTRVYESGTVREKFNFSIKHFKYKKGWSKYF